MNPAPSVVVFDLGKVLVDFDYNLAARRIAERSTRSWDPVGFFTEHATLLFRYEVGFMTTDEFFKQIQAITGFSGTQKEFGALFGDIFSPIQPMIELHAALRSRQLPTFIFSNTNELAISHIRRRYPFFSLFDGYILSYEHGAMKPEEKLYEAVERETRKQGKAILYLDDRPENIEAGRARGWQTILHQSSEATLADMARFGLLNRTSSGR